ncbi:hypothetical protein [Dactylosporangium sp. NPDC049140]|uniref:hypothetical protein n=1 Tax=Dactylosporangium sp. NPDC049140 TaxID=3155647 RepID=UPI0033C16380
MRHATVFADYGQFYMQDAEAHGVAMRASAATDPGRVAGGWTQEAVQVHRIGLEPHSISIGAARSDFVETVLKVCETAPALVPESEHVVEADLDVLTGAVSVVSCTEPRRAENALRVEPGRYRVRVSYVPAAPPPSAHPDVDGDHFSYLIEMWPSREPAPLAVVVQGPFPWAN